MKFRALTNGGGNYFAGDHLGSWSVNIKLTDDSVFYYEHYTPFGELLNPGGPGNLATHGFTGHVRDADTGLSYMQARFYDPIVGRFLQTDPIGYQDQFNLYAYVANDPVNNWDPNGENAVSNYYRGITDWARDTGYFIGGRLVVPATRGLYSPAAYKQFQTGLALSNKILDFGISNAGKLAPKAVERMAENPAYTAGRITAGAAVGRFALSKTSYGPVGGASLGVTMPTIGQIDRFAQSAVSGNFDKNLELGAPAQEIIGGYFENAGFDTKITDNKDGTSTEAPPESSLI